ncbi:MAG: hypothetical protein OEY51_03015 [Cyclobacteriaceae bacterium]|nr:hypothetical protein [Cyclobacteriaceae bacterium]
MPIKKVDRKLILFSILFFYGWMSTPFLCHSQVKIKSFHAGLTINGYAGDLHPRMEMWQMGYQIGASVQHGKNLEGTAVVGSGLFTGQNILFPREPIPGVFPSNYFRMRYVMAQYELKYTFLRVKNFVFYGAAGPALLFFQSHDGMGQPLRRAAMTRLENETYSNSSFCLTTGPGIVFILPNDFSVAFHPVYVLPFNDYIDNISRLRNSKNLDQLLQFRLEFHVPVSELKKK